MSVVVWKAKHNRVQKEMRGCSLAMPIGAWPKHQLTLCHLGKPTMVLRSGTSSIPQKETLGAEDDILHGER